MSRNPLPLEGPTPRAEQLARRIEDGLARDGARPGQHLGTKDELSSGYQVAKSTVNEALRILQARGVIDTRSGPRGGVFVATPPPFMKLGHLALQFKHGNLPVADCMSIRRQLEPLIVEEAARYATDADVADLSYLEQTMRRSVSSPPAFIEASLAFHRRLGLIAKNALLKEIYSSLTDFVSAELSEAEPFESSYEDAIASHLEILDAVQRHDPQAARRAAERHDYFLIEGQLPSPADGASAP